MSRGSNSTSATSEIEEPLPSTGEASNVAAEHTVSNERRQNNHWIASARFLLVWVYPATVALYLKWYLMADQQGFVREARSMGLRSLSLTDCLALFRQDLLLGGLVIPLVLLLAFRFLPMKWKALVSGIVSGIFLLIVSIQLFSLKEVGRFCSWAMLKVGLSWGWHESGSNLTYLFSRPALLLALSVTGMLVTLMWAARTALNGANARSSRRWKTSGELYCFGIIAAVLVSLHSNVLNSPYRESMLARSVSSLWQGSEIDSPEFFGFEFEQHDHFAVPNFSQMPAAQLVNAYRQVSDAPGASSANPYFGKQSGANVLFFILETTPEEYLPVKGDLSQFPNIATLRERSFIGERHYTTFPLTRCALFSIFSSWYPIDEPNFVFGSIQNDRPPDFLRLLHSRGYTTAIFSPLKSSGISDDVVFRALGFDHQYYPSAAISDYDNQPTWREARVAADRATLKLLLGKIDTWNASGQRFVAAFAPQTSHYPYPDGSADNSPAGLKKRARSLLSVQDSWLGQIVNELQSNRQLQNTIIVIVGDHGPRTIEENPALRRGTIDETAFHVPLFIYAPRALQKPDEILWLTSHIDLAPTLLDLLGEKRDRNVEQGAPIWDAALQRRTTFFFARQMFGADGYFRDGRFYMWHYFSNDVYQNSQDLFDPTDIVAVQSEVHGQATKNILQIAGIEKAWHRKFSESADESQASELLRPMFAR